MRPRSLSALWFSLAGIVVLAAAAVLAPTARAQATPTDKWLHVRVDNAEAKGEMVRVNLPLDFAEKVLPTINHGNLHYGKVRIGHAEMNEVDLRALLDAVRTAKDGEFVTVQSNENDVRVEKKGGYLLAHVLDKQHQPPKHVEVRVPMTVVDALLSTGTQELDLVAAIRALAAHGDTELVSIDDGKSKVRVWVDSKNISD